MASPKAAQPLLGQVALVTGAAQNIGREIALELAHCGADLVINTRSNISLANEVAKQVTSLGRKVLVVKADVSVQLQVESLFKLIRDEFGKIDILINNAGSGTHQKITDTSPENWQNAFMQNVVNAVLCSKEAVKLMQLAGSGAIINIASVRGLKNCGHPGMLSYSAAKAALINFTTTLAKAMAPQIRVNGIAPGYVRTASVVNQSAGVKYINMIDIARCATMLILNKAIIGQTITLDGGFSLKNQ